MCPEAPAKMMKGKMKSILPPGAIVSPVPPTSD